MTSTTQSGGEMDDGYQMDIIHTRSATPSKEEEEEEQQQQHETLSTTTSTPTQSPISQHEPMDEIITNTTTLATTISNNKTSPEYNNNNNNNNADPKRMRQSMDTPPPAPAPPTTTTTTTMTNHIDLPDDDRVRIENMLQSKPQESRQEYMDAFLKELHICLKTGKAVDRQKELDNELPIKRQDDQLKALETKISNEENELKRIKQRIQENKTLLETFERAKRLINGEGTLEELTAYKTQLWSTLGEIRQRLRQARSQQQTNENNKLCQICFIQRRDAIWTGCGHLYCCYQCSIGVVIVRCPVCNSTDGQFLRVRSA
jgi:hypothetical protein